MQTQVLTRAEARRALAEYRHGQVPILRLHTLAVHGAAGVVQLPAVYLDTSRRPDVADLGRVHRLEGDSGDVETEWAFLLGRLALAVLTLKLLRPARCTFRLHFDLARDFDFLAQLALCGRLVVTPFDPEREPERAAAAALSVEVSCDGLAGALTGFALARVAAEAS